MRRTVLNARFFLIPLLSIGAAPMHTGQVAPAAGQVSTPPDDARLAKLPPALRGDGRRILAETDEPCEGRHE